eukprot:NODE_3682_length_935_cov_31.571106_g3383_i0.p2 GENE.NODE_3682_length_935_cov_31.571106_g3383_i0~~NODE_3682_length_935_cov_31.571106_g3383_i0.p2  ORF type:complete len:147 (+),score=29.17 NODE_3682_length_935_cov_31.571106_g3383_i0:397-837(+)
MSESPVDASTAPPEDEIARSLSQIMLPLACQYEERINAVNASQQILEHKINRLVSELTIAADNALVPEVNEYLGSLANSRRKVTAINDHLRAIRERLGRVHTSATQKYGALKAANEATADRIANLEAEARAPPAGVVDPANANANA